MEMEQHYVQGAVPENNNMPVHKWKKSHSDAAVDSDDDRSSGFDCNICLDLVQDPVVTLCGHLFCWPCIYKWLHFQTKSAEKYSRPLWQQCPVCKAEVSQDTLVPLFGKGQSTNSSKSKNPNLGIVIPRRPLSLACEFDSPRSPITSLSPGTTNQIYHRQSPLSYPQMGSYGITPILSPGSTAANLFHPVIGVIGEMMDARTVGNSVTNMYSYQNSVQLPRRISPRLRRHVLQADRSLDRISFFLFCCVLLCLFLF